MPQHQTIYDAAIACRKRLRECLEIPALMGDDEWARKRIADFNIWASGSGALAKEKASLDERLSTKQSTRSVVLSLLSLLDGLVEQVQRQARRDDDGVTASSQISHPSEDGGDDEYQAPLSESLSDVDGIVRQLVRISIAIRKSGAGTRLERADRSFNPDRHYELKTHLSLLILVQTRVRADREAGSRHIHLELPLNNLDTVQRRLIEANLRRRHRFLYARRRWIKQAKERARTTPVPEPREVAASSASQILKLHDPGTSPKRKGSPGPPERDLVLPKGEGSAAAITITSTTPTAFEGPVEIPHSSQPSMTIASSTSSKVIYPRPPRIPDGQSVFQCPCCYQSLPASLARGNRWRKHVTEDVLPYTCVLPDCTQPQPFYQTREQWMKHMQDEHISSQYWLCFACAHPSKFTEQYLFVQHLTTQHGDTISPGQIQLFVSECCCNVPLSFSSCPLCPPPPPQDDTDRDALLKHVAEHIHSFSLISLPWPSPGDDEIDYLGLQDQDIGVEYFALSSGRGSLEQTQSSDSQERRRDFEAEGLPELTFEDVDSRAPSPWPDTTTFNTTTAYDLDPVAASLRQDEALPLDEVKPDRRFHISLPEESPPFGDDDAAAQKVRKPGLFTNVRTRILRTINSTDETEEAISQAVGRREIQNFKSVWLKLVSEASLLKGRPTGDFIHTNQVPDLLRKLSGRFDTRIYEEEDSIQNLLKLVDNQRGQPQFPLILSSALYWTITFKKMHSKLGDIDFIKVRKRRKTLNWLHEELLCQAEAYEFDRGKNAHFITRYTTLFAFAYYKFGLDLEDPLVRREKVDMVRTNLARKRIAGFFDMIYLRRKFLRHIAMEKVSRVSTVPPLFDRPEPSASREDDVADSRDKTVDKRRYLAMPRTPHSDDDADWETSMRRPTWKPPPDYQQPDAAASPAPAPPGYEEAVGVPSADGLADYFARLSDYVDESEEVDEDDSGTAGPSRTISFFGRDNRDPLGHPGS